MKNYLKFAVLIALFLGVLAACHAEEAGVGDQISVSANDTNTSQDIMNITQNITEDIPQIIDFNVLEISPKETDKGNILFKILIGNTGNVQLKNLVPLIVARGFSTYDVTPVSVLDPGETGTSFISGNIDETGNILLTIKINDRIFYDSINVKEPEITVDYEKIKAEEEKRKKIMTDIALQLDEIKKKYKDLEANLTEKEEDYYISEVSLEELKKYIMDAQSGLILDDIKKANVSIILALNEYEDQKFKLDSAQKKPFLQKIKDNILPISAIAAAIVTFFSLYEILKKKHEVIYTKIKQIKTSKGTETTVETKENKKDSKKESKK